jgi:hypothetical protein
MGREKSRTRQAVDSMQKGGYGNIMDGLESGQIARLGRHRGTVARYM